MQILTQKKQKNTGNEKVPNTRLTYNSKDNKITVNPHCNLEILNNPRIIVGLISDVDVQRHPLLASKVENHRNVLTNTENFLILAIPAFREITDEGAKNLGYTEGKSNTVRLVTNSDITTTLLETYDVKKSTCQSFLRSEIPEEFNKYILIQGVAESDIPNSEKFLKKITNVYNNMMFTYLDVIIIDTDGDEAYKAAVFGYVGSYPADNERFVISNVRSEDIKYVKK